MAQHTLRTWFFVICILAVIVVNYYVFSPYLGELFVALVFAIALDPIQNRLTHLFKGREGLSSLATVALAIVLIALPASFFGTLLFQEASDLYTSVVRVNGGSGTLSATTASIQSLVSTYFPGVNFAALELDLAGYMRQGLSWVLSHSRVFIGGFLSFFFSAFLMLLALFYFLKDGKRFVAALVDLSPLADASDRRIAERVVVAVNSVIRGHLVIGLLQGTLTGIGFALFGMPNPVLWGAIAAVASLVPTVGTSLILIPGILFLAATGNVLPALGLLAWGALAVGLVDNLIGPVLIQRGVNIHPLLILLSALGGISYFGPVGFLAGPVVLALLFAFLDLYPDIVQENTVS
jgi:predicted PurR-regulated permease PerM